MGQNTNIGFETALTVTGNPESFVRLINNHGQLCKVKQAIPCPCVAANNGSADYLCELCNGDGYVYTYQRRFLVSDEDSRTCDNKIYPFWNPILSVDKVQNVAACVQGGITNLTVSSFDSTSITLIENANNYTKKRVTYSFDGWTYVESEKLRVDAANKIMYADGTIYDAGFQSSNPLNAYADIAKVVRIWNNATGEEIVQYETEGNTITTNSTLDPDNMYMEYYYSDLTKTIHTDVNNRENNEVYTHELKDGECKMAFYQFVELSKGDIITLAATILYRSEQITHIGSFDKLWEIEVFDLGENIFDEDGNVYSIDIDYILQGRHIKWLGTNKPADNKIISVRYGYKPSYIVFENNPVPNALENKQYPVIVLAKSWSKISKDDITRLVTS